MDGSDSITACDHCEVQHDSADIYPQALRRSEAESTRACCYNRGIMKKLKQKQLGPWCSYCPPKTTRATYRQDGFSGKFCCDGHKENLEADEQEEYRREQRYTEADDQTWGRL